MTGIAQESNSHDHLTGTWHYVGGGALTLPPESSVGSVVAFGSEFVVSPDMIKNSFDRNGHSQLVEWLTDEDNQLRDFGELAAEGGPWPPGVLRSRPGSAERATEAQDARVAALRIPDADRRAQELLRVREVFGGDYFGNASRSHTLAKFTARSPRPTRWPDDRARAGRLGTVAAGSRAAAPDRPGRCGSSRGACRVARRLWASDGQPDPAGTRPDRHAREVAVPRGRPGRPHPSRAAVGMTADHYGAGKAFQADVTRFLRASGFDVEMTGQNSPGHLAGLPAAFEISAAQHIDLADLLGRAHGAARAMSRSTRSSAMTRSTANRVAVCDARRIAIGIAKRQRHGTDVAGCYALMTLGDLAALLALAWPDLVSRTPLPEEPEFRPVTRPCGWRGCRTEFVPPSARQVYCSRSCRDRCQRDRDEHKAQTRAHARAQARAQRSDEHSAA